MGTSLETFTWGLSLGQCCLGDSTLKLPFGNSRLEASPWELSLGNSRLVTFAWDLFGGIFRLGALALDMDFHSSFSLLGFETFYDISYNLGNF